MIVLLLLLPGMIAYVPTYKILKDADAIIIGTVLAVKGDEPKRWAEIRIDTILRGKIKDSIIELPFHYRYWGPNVYISPEPLIISYIPGTERLLILERVNRKEVPEGIGKATEFDVACTRTLFGHSKPRRPKEENITMWRQFREEEEQFRKEKPGRIKRFCRILNLPIADERAEELYRWYKEIENEGARYEVLEAIGMEESRFSFDVMEEVLLNGGIAKNRACAAEAIGRFACKDDSLDSLLIQALEDPSGEVKSQALTSLAWRRKGWAIPYIKKHLNDTLCCGKVVRVLSGYYHIFDTDSLLVVVSKIPCEPACNAALDIIRSGVHQWVYLQKSQLSPASRDSITSILKVIPWTSKLRDSLISFMNHRYEPVERSAMLTLAVSEDTTLFSLFKKRIHNQKKKLFLLEGDEKEKIKRELSRTMYALSELGDRRAAPLLLSLLRETIQSEPEERAIALISAFLLGRLGVVEVVPGLEELLPLTEDSKIKKRINQTIRKLKEIRNHR